MNTDPKDVMAIQQIANEIEKLIASEKDENDDTGEAKDVGDLEQALDLVRKYADEEIKEPSSSLKGESATPSTDVVKPVNTGLLTGPMPALKNFLVQRQRDNEAQ